MNTIRRILAIFRRKPTAPTAFEKAFDTELAARINRINPKPWTPLGQRLVANHMIHASRRGALS